MKKRKLKAKHIFMALVVCYVGYTLVSQQIMISRIKKDINTYGQENKKIEESNAYLKDQIEFAKTKEYKERMARERIGLVLPGEKVYVIDYQK